ncbi:hypothetical protein [uncultured Vagococcus sp.]|uniref:hypothetical protein n=1 Tax=uncultured Vagococcus sp. TaxID=189676 RepID=UPI0028D385FB|nr:hypothetical protein [uncultured Vagococcus sp.]
MKLKTSLLCMGAGALFSLSIPMNAEAHAVLTGGTDLKGYDATIITDAQGTTILSTKKGTYELQSNSTIYSSKDIKITLNNSQPITINGIQAAKDLEFRGAGELDVTTTSDVAINVGNHLKAFKYSGNGKVVGTANGTGVKVHNEIQMKDGTVEGYGNNFGVYSDNDIKPYYGAVLKGTSENGIGIYAYRDIYAWKGATVVGKGKISGARSIIAHIQAEDAGSSITGISTNINSHLSALHADKQMLRAYSGAAVNEVYENSGLVITDNPFVINQAYKTVGRNMSNIENYVWSSNPKAVAIENGGLVVNTSFKDGQITAVRQNAALKKGNEVTQLKKDGRHTVTFSGASTELFTTLLVKHWVDLEDDLGYRLYTEEEIQVEVGDLVNVNMLQFDFTEEEMELDSSDSQDFVAVKSKEPKVINFYYTGEL